jgi:fatty-acyl-CoA synthase
MAEHPTFTETDLNSLRYAVVGGAPMPAELLRTWHNRGVALIEGYGLSEAAPNVLCAGRPYPYVATKIADGELLVRGPNVFTGYWRDPAATEKALADGWLHTGDLAHQGADGCYHILDRVDDMYVSGGENVFPSEVENVLYGHPAVAEAAVVGQPDDRWGKVGQAYVVRRPGTDVAEAELIEQCRANLAGYKVPHEIIFVAELPHSAVGKLLRRNLRKEGNKP